MQAIKALTMIKDGRIDELIALLKDEIYANSLRRKPGAKQRYTAMKKYFSYADSVREVCQKPAKVIFEGTEYTAFTDSYSLVLTTEPIGEIELIDESINYPNVTRLINFEGEERQLDIGKVIAKAKSEGYKLLKREYFSNHCLFHYGGTYFRIALLDNSYKIIANGGESTVYHREGIHPLVIKNEIGICMILPIRRSAEDAELDKDKIIVELDDILEEGSV